MIVGPANLVYRTLQLATNTGDVLVEFLFKFQVDPRIAVFRAEHDVKQHV